MKKKSLNVAVRHSDAFARGNLPSLPVRGVHQPILSCANIGEPYVFFFFSVMFLSSLFRRLTLVTYSIHSEKEKGKQEAGAYARRGPLPLRPPRVQLRNDVRSYTALSGSHAR